MRTLIVLFLALVPLAAQRTIVVDANQGSGFDFTDIPPAIVAAQDGDTVLVRAGTYSPVQVANKAIALLGLGGVLIDSPQIGLAAIDVINLPAGRECTVRGFRGTGLYLLATFAVRDCAGRVLCEDLIGDRFFLGNNHQVLLNRCEWGGQTTCANSKIALSSCVGRGDAGFGLTSAGLNLQTSSATCADCSFAGLPGLLGFASGPGISLLDSSLRLAGDASNSIAAGTMGGIPDVSAITGTGTLDLDPDVVLVPLGNAPPIEAAVTVRTLNLPVLTAAAGGLRELVTIDLAAQPGESYFLFWARAGEALPLPLLDGELWLDPATIVLASSGTLDATGATRFQFRAPRLPGLIGAQFAWQGVTGSAANLRLSNPAGYAHLP